MTQPLPKPETFPPSARLEETLDGKFQATVWTGMQRVDGPQWDPYTVAVTLPVQEFDTVEAGEAWIKEQLETLKKVPFTQSYE